MAATTIEDTIMIPGYFLKQKSPLKQAEAGKVAADYSCLARLLYTGFCYHSGSA